MDQQLRYGACGHDKLLAFLMQAEWVPPVVRCPAHERKQPPQPKFVTPVLQAVHRVIIGHLLGQDALKADEADSGAVTLIQRFGSAPNLNFHCLVLHTRINRAQSQHVVAAAQHWAGRIEVIGRNEFHPRRTRPVRHTSMRCGRLLDS